MTDVFTAPLREADASYAQASENCTSGCTAPVVTQKPEPLCAECAREMHQ